MRKAYRFLSILFVIPLCFSSCSPQAAQEQQSRDNGADSIALLDKPLTEVMDQVEAGTCSRAAQFQLCRNVGMAFWLDANQVVKGIYLYVNNTDGFSPYDGELPFGLKFYDTLGAVEYKLKRQGIGQSGLPDDAGTPDHFHYWATYHRAHMTIIYNSPFPDEDATIYAVLLHA